VVQDQDGVLGLDDLQEGDTLSRLPLPDHRTRGPSGLVGRPLTEVERYYIEQTLQVTEGNREEAARLLGIGERTLYRIMQDWKLQDRIREAIEQAGGNFEKAALGLGMSATSLERKVKKWGLRFNSE
jgi:two-component system response regulator HydG